MRLANRERLLQEVSCAESHDCQKEYYEHDYTHTHTNTHSLSLSLYIYIYIYIYILFLEFKDSVLWEWKAVVEFGNK